MIEPLIRNKVDDLDHQRKSMIGSLESIIEQIKEDRKVVLDYLDLLENLQRRIATTSQELDLVVHTDDLTPETLAHSLAQIKVSLPPTSMLCMHFFHVSSGVPGSSRRISSIGSGRKSTQGSDIPSVSVDRCGSERFG